MSRQRGNLSPRKALGILSGGRERKRKSWTFEKLEDRLCFSAQPLQTVVSYSSDTPDGAAQTQLREFEWAQVQAGNEACETGPLYVTMSLPNDPLFQDQWHLLNTGQEVGNPDVQHLYGVAGEDINVVPAWNMLDANGNPITGQGVLVAVIDTGVQLFHPDLAGNISPTLRFNSVDGTSNVSPSLIDPEAGHGTSVAGIIAAVANNGEGGTGVAPGATIVPIKADAGFGFSDQAIEDAFLYALQNNVDVTNNSYGPGGRVAFPQDATMTEILRQMVVNGRDGKGMINVFASGNDGGPSFSQGFPSVGDYSSASYNPLVNSRFTIGVGGVDHDGLYKNADGTFTSYPESGPSVLVAAPTGSNILGATNIGDDDGFGSGIWTTDLVGDFGFNAAALPNGFDPDRDLLPDPDYTSRFNGTSAAAPVVSGVVALMLQANPNLTFRDVQEILVRSSRQNAQFESPTSGGIGASSQTKNTWQTNQTGPFRNPDSFFSPFFTDNTSAFFFPIADPSVDPVFNFTGNGGFQGFNQFFAPGTNDDNRQISSEYEPEPALFTNGAGYTVSQGYGIYGEQLGYAHGVVDAAAAVEMAKQWNILGQNLDPNTELTYTTAVVSPVGPIPAAEKVADPPNGNRMLVPGGIDGQAGFIAYWNQYFSTTPFANYTGPSAEGRGASYIDFAVPPDQQMSVEWVEVKVDLSGAGASSVDGLNGLRIMLVSPDGTQSELNNYYPNASWAPDSTQPSSTPANGWQIDFGQGLNGAGGNFVWTFSTNRSFGESSDSEAIIHPVTGEPVLQEVDTFDQTTQQLTTTTEPIFRNWEVHIENWSHSSFNLNAVEVIWHGKPVGGGTYDANYGDSGILNAQRVQGVVAIDTNGDEQFSANPADPRTNQFNTRYTQTVSGSHADVSDIRDGDVTRQLNFSDNNHNGIYDQGDTVYQEPFAANVIVDAYKVWGGVSEATPTARFLTGADGNYYFDLDPQGDLAQTTNPLSPHFGQTIEYQIRVTDPLGRNILEDIDTPSLTTTNPSFTYLPHYKQTWTINPNWFYAPDHDNPLLLGNNPGEIFFDPTTKAPVSFDNSGTITRVPMGVKDLNFLLKDDAPANNFNAKGTVYSDVNGDGQFNGTDAAAAGVSVYWDKNRDGIYNAGELKVLTDANGQYTLPIDLTTLTPVPTGDATYQIGVIKPTVDWTFTDPGHDGVETIFAGPGSADQIVNFFLKPPGSQNPNGNGPGTVQGLVFSDLNGNGTQDIGEAGVPNFRVFIDANQNGVWDSATEVSALTGANGTFFFANVQPGVYRVDVVIPNEGTPTAAWNIVSPAAGFRDVQLIAGGSVTAVSFALKNLAGSDWGDLPDSYSTTLAANGPRHVVTPGFQLGASVDGEVNGIPTPGATGEGLVGDNDDGVIVLSNGGVLKKGVNTIQVTVAGVGGLLTGWMDFNADGHFDDTMINGQPGPTSERLIWSLNGVNLTGEADLNPGTYSLQVTIPASAVDGPLAARFRWGEQGLSFNGPSAIGEVEDYFLGLNYIYGDYNRNGTVDLADYLLWRNTVGQNVAPFSGADGNGDGVINQADYDVWKSHFGESLPGPGAGAGAGALVLDSGNSSSGSATGGSGVATGADLSALAAGSSGVAGGPGYVALGPSGNVPSTPAQVTSVVATTPSNSASVTVSGQAFAAFTSVGDQSLSFQVNAGVGQQPVTNTAQSNSNLLLLDLAWAGVDNTSYDVADNSLYDSSHHEDTHVSDLALAAVMTEDSDWWSEI